MYEFLVGLDVSDNEVYSDYRAAMKPILTSYGGEFGFDFIVSEVLRSEVDKPINRVFTIRFPDQSVAENFFTDSEYLKVKEQLFDTAVSHTTIISSYNKEV
ncbi:DUF1330 domain-containing protein [Vibrio tubiashii]|uniref:DUF1330 domain-containing protein n=1 Tax=Vibrio tubiashii ATCC 19109 TaxID=1051646 RepID=F9T8C2_9VIBR|nr:DUF1330 domain-containing protein [Vibrio tubiashii]AIW14087.1 hypothetical protein IX91_07715 [Vibrio tubiashii ATCC 19109]EGU52930.1 hypothetical protein VITU9109_03997 [Vibrio tubiashii ATCC 19109]EIF03131.1 hypothetical protein VT1337_14709 [Vibrio tubiashii NCIMB 1337 = ATCC 19106]